MKTTLPDTQEVLDICAKRVMEGAFQSALTDRRAEGQPWALDLGFLLSHSLGGRGTMQQGLSV